MARHDEPTLNTYLATVLRRRSPSWRKGDSLFSEGLGALEERGKPDIVVEPPGLHPIVVETEVEPAATVEEEARGRLGKHTKATGKPIRHAVAVRLPVTLRSTPESALLDALGEARVEYAVVSTAPRADRFPRRGWLEGGVDDLAGLVERLSVSEQAVAKSTTILEQGIERAAERLRHELQKRLEVLSDVASLLHQEPGVQTDRMAMAIVGNACTFHASIVGVHDGIRVASLDELRTPNGVLPVGRVLSEWRTILTEINYWPIFAIARTVLEKIPAGVASGVLDGLARTADDLEAEGVTRSHDLTGRMFQRLIADRKFLATFYTRPEAAALLAELAVGMMSVDWSASNSVTRLRVGDLACGTGTLLLAAYNAIISRFRRAGGNDARLHRQMMEESLIAADIMPAAAHLTASMLSSVHPRIRYRRTQVFTLPYGTHQGVSGVSLGSLSLLDSEKTPSLYGTGLAAGITGLGGKSAVSTTAGQMNLPSFALADSSLDLAIMNPPFTRPTNHEVSDEAVPSFAGFGNTEAEQRAMSLALKQLRAKLVKSRRTAGEAGPAGHGNAGEGSNFLDLAHNKLRPGGLLAIVLPSTLALGNGWELSRRLLARHYRSLLIISLVGAKGRDKSFSADTSLGEVLVLARKRQMGALGPVDPHDAEATWIIAERRPKSAAEAMEISRSIHRESANSSSGHGTFAVSVGNDNYAKGVRATLSDGGCVGVHDTELIDGALGLRDGFLPLPRQNGKQVVPIVRLGSLGTRGPVDRDIYSPRDTTSNPRGPFFLVPVVGAATFPILWWHHAKPSCKRERRLVVEPDRMGVIRPGMDRKAASIWASASRLHFNRDFGLRSQSLAACLTPRRSMGGRAWPSFQPTDASWEEPLAVWANTTLGLILFWWTGTTQQDGRANLTVARLPDLPVVNMRALDPSQIGSLTESAAWAAEHEFLPAHLAAEDPTRIELDSRVLQEALGFDAEAMEQVALLRRKWCLEATVHGGKSDRILA